ncbi:MAG: hypothetical protein AAGC63_00345 [Propionicimonas sp.]|nr:hypothetical protein [Propionicimonas sp.]
MRAADVAEIKARLTSIGADPYEQKPATTPPREYVVIYGGEARSRRERLAAVQITNRQVWRLMCVSASLDVLRILAVKVAAEFTNSRIGGPQGGPVEEVDVGPELTDGTGPDLRYSQTLTFAHHHTRRTTP